MIISHSKKLIFIHAQRTGGSSTSNVLRSILTDKDEVYDQHSNAKMFEPSFFEQYHDYYKFGFTRNPWERILSWYSLIYFNEKKDLVEERVRLEKFIELGFSDHSFHYNTLDYFTNKDGKVIADQIFRYENLENEIGIIAKQFNIKLSEIPKVNVTEPKDYKKYYTDKSRMLIDQKCEKDIQHFNYTFE